MVEKSALPIKVEAFKVKGAELAPNDKLDKLDQFCEYIEQQKKELWLTLHPGLVTKQDIKQFSRARRWLDGLLQSSYRNLSTFRVHTPISTRVKDQAQSLAKLRKVYGQFPLKARPHVFEYEPDMLELARKENIGSIHHDKGFEPCYDWGGFTKKPIPSWAQAYLDKTPPPRTEGKIPRKELPSEVTDQGIEYCTHNYKENKPVVRAYRKIGYKPSKYFCQHCLYKLDDAQIGNRMVVCPKCGNILFPPERIDAIIEKRMEKLKSESKNEARHQESQYKSNRQQWLDQQWQSYREVFQNNPLLEEKVREFIKADYLMNPGQYSRSLLRASGIPQFSLKPALFRMIALRKQLFRYLTNQELALHEKRVKKGQVLKLDAKDLFFSGIRERFLFSSFTVPQLLYFLLLCSDVSITRSSRKKSTPLGKEASHEDSLTLSLDLHAWYQTLFDLMFLRFKKPFTLHTSFQFSRDDYLKFSIKDPDQAGFNETDVSRRSTSPSKTFLDNLDHYFHSFRSELFHLRKEGTLHECKLDFQVAFQALWEQFQAIPLSGASSAPWEKSRF